jgi:hypothetical protein
VPRHRSQHLARGRRRPTRVVAHRPRSAPRKRRRALRVPSRRGSRRRSEAARRPVPPRGGVPESRLPRRSHALRMREPLDRNRSGQHRQRYLTTEHTRGGRDAPHIHEHARTKLPALESRNVVAQRYLIASATREIRMRIRIKLLLGQALVVPDVDRKASRTTLTPAEQEEQTCRFTLRGHCRTQCHSRSVVASDG